MPFGIDTEAALHYYRHRYEHTGWAENSLTTAWATPFASSTCRVHHCAVHQQAAGVC